MMITHIVPRYVNEILPKTEREISEVEEGKIWRGLYRFQLFVELFSDVFDENEVNGIRVANRAMGRGFLTVWEPWVRSSAFNSFTKVLSAE